MRTLWNGILAFGRIGIPVGLAATHKAGGGGPVFKTLHGECATPLEQKRWCPTHEREVTADELVKGWEAAKGNFVVLDPDELEQLAPDTENRTIELVGFTPAGQLDPIEYARGYYLAPAEQAIGRRPYLLLAQVLRETGMVALARFVAWDDEQLCAIRPLNGSGALVLHTLKARDKLNPAGPIDDLLAVLDPPLLEREIDLGSDYVMRRFDELDHLDLASRHDAQVLALLQHKLAGNQIRRPERPDPPPLLELGQVDLTAALKASIRDTPPRRRRKPARPKTTAAAKS